MRDLYLTGQLEHFFLSEDPQLTSALADHRERGPR
jgi:hypothetical protein